MQSVKNIRMLTTKEAVVAIKVLVLLLIAALSFFFATAKFPETGFIRDSLESVENSSATVMKFSAATLSTSLAISALPDDFATPLADSLADMNFYFIIILVILFLEKILIRYGVALAFAILIPAACILYIPSFFVRRRFLRLSRPFKSFAVRLCVLSLAVALVVPCSTHLTHFVAADLTEYVEETIRETEDGADKLNEAMADGAEGKTIFEKLSDLFQTAIHGISDLMQHFQNMIRKCMNSIAILILTDCLMPLLTFFFLKWIIRELFQIVIPLPAAFRRYDGGGSLDPGPVPAGEEAPQ